MTATAAPLRAHKPRVPGNPGRIYKPNFKPAKCGPFIAKPMSKEKNQRPQAVRITSPRATFVWPELVTPSNGTPEYPKPDGEFKVTLRLDADGLNTLRALLAPSTEAAKNEAEAKFNAMPIAQRKKIGAVQMVEIGNPEYDRETEEETGFYLVKVSAKASGTRQKDGSRWEFKPPLFDSRGSIIKNPPAIWSGTEGKVSFDAVPYFVPATGHAGVSLRLKAAQILVLRSGGAGSSAGDFGFGAEADEDGYEANAFTAEGGANDETAQASADF